MTGPSWRRRVSRSFYAHVDWKNHPAEILPEKQPKGSDRPLCCDSGCARNMSQPKIKQNRYDGRAEKHHRCSTFGLTLCDDEQQRKSNNQHAFFMRKQCTKSGDTIANKIFHRRTRQIPFCKQHPKQQETGGQAVRTTGDPRDCFRAGDSGAVSVVKENKRLTRSFPGELMGRQIQSSDVSAEDREDICSRRNSRKRNRPLNQCNSTFAR